MQAPGRFIIIWRFLINLLINTEALGIYQSLNDTSRIAGVLSKIGNLHSSREFCEKRTAEEKLSDTTQQLTFLKDLQICTL